MILTMRVTKMLSKEKVTYKLMLIVLACLICLGPLSAQTVPPSLAGDYEGKIGPLHLIFHLRQSAGTGVTGTLDSIDQDSFGDRCADITRSGMKFSFILPDANASYQGEIGPDGNTITGTWTQQNSGPLVFERKAGMENDYTGMLGPFHLTLHLRRSADTGMTGTIDTFDQHALELQCAGVVESGTKLSFTVPEKHLSYQGEISPGGDTITGTWQERASAPLVFTRRPEKDATGLQTDTKSGNEGRSAWAYFGPDGKLVYRKTSQGDRIPDFSSAGYRAGGVALPRVETRMKISPTGGADDTPAIQAALDQVAKLAPGAQGIRGAVELAPGTYHLKGTLHLNVSGVVLRGTGSEGASAAVLEMTGDPHLAMEIKGDFQRRELGPATTLTDSYVPAGATSIHVADASDIHPGDTLEIVKPVTPQWIHFMGMDQLVRNGKPEEWVKNDIRVRRQVVSIEGNAVKLSVPLTDSFDAEFYPGIQPAVTRVQISGQIAETGIENLRIVAPKRSIDYHQDGHFDGVEMDNIVDSWLRGLAFVDTTNSVNIDHNSERLTIVSVDVQQHDHVTSRAQPFDFSISGSQVLLDRCSATGDRVTYVATQSHSEGPVVVLHCRFNGSGKIEGHQRWSTGFLVDNCAVPDGSINLRNRGFMGTGHGWASGWSVLWNSEAEAFLVQNPPGDLNWSIGNVGEHISVPMPVSDDQLEGPPLPGGIAESVGTHVGPKSLYLAQLRERKGSAAVKAIGYRVE